jgi:hypothetical protein
MKKLLLLFILAGFARQASAQMPSSCNVPATLQTNYDKDVKHLALLRITAQNSPYQDSIVIPASYQDTIMKGLAAIYNLTSFQPRDSVFDNYCIHQDISTIYTDIYVGLDTSYAWTHNWQNLNTATGIPALDNLLSTYGFSVVYYSNFGSPYARLSTSQHINAVPLCDSLDQFGGVNYSEPDSYMGDGNRVEYHTSGSDRFYDFSVGYGDCPAGCTSRLYFKFKVDAGCAVTYIGRFNYNTPNDVCPGPLNCNITAVKEHSAEDPGFTAFPNPVTDNITITAKYSDLKNVNVTAIDVLGKKVPVNISGISADGHSLLLSTEKLESGIYFLQISQDEKVREIIKIRKE